MRDSLEALYIRFDTSFGTLADTAMAQLIMKIAYSIPKGFTIRQMKHHSRQLLKTDNIQRISVDKAIKTLVKENKLETCTKGYRLTYDIKSAIDKSVTQSKERLTRLLLKYFDAASSDSNAVKKWFQFMNIHFFQEFSADWVNDLYRVNVAKRSANYSVNRIAHWAFRVNKEIKKDDYDWLEEQYTQYLSSRDPDECAIKWGYCTSLFSSTLLVAGLSADPLALDMLRDSTIIFDTNILMRIQLEGYRYYSSVQTLDKLFHALNARLIFLYITQDEYRHAVEIKRREVINALSKFPIEIVQDADDPFIRTGRQRRCRTSEDYERLFSELSDMPTVMYENCSITLFDEESVEYAIQNGMRDEGVKKRLNDIYKCKYRRNKKDVTLEHDSGLISACCELRKSGQSWILTTDNVLREYSQKHCIRDDYPVSLSMPGLIQMLALDSASIGIDPTDCAPLFAEMIQMALEPDENAFQLEDLSRMYQVRGNIEGLGEQAVKRIAIEVHKRRMKGATEEEIALLLNRRFEKERITSISDLEETREELSRKSHEYELLKHDNIKYRNQIIDKKKGELRDEYDGKVRKSRIIWYLIIPFIITSIIYILVSSISGNWLANGLIAATISIFGWVIGDVCFWRPKLFKKHSEYIAGIDSEAVEYADMLIEGRYQDSE